MSKLLLSNDKDKYLSMHNDFVNAGFSKFKTHDVNQEIFLSAYKKLRVDSENLYCDDDDFVAVSGTYIYKENIGKGALVQTLHDFDGNNMMTLRCDIIGSYALIIKKGNYIYIFVDENHTYQFYYYHNMDQYIVTNTYYHIEKQVKELFNMDIMFDKLCGYFFIDNMTPFDNIFQLLGYQYIEIDLINHLFNVKTIDLNRYPLKVKSFEESITEVQSRLQRVVKIIAKTCPRITVFSTGGLDSRLILSSFLNSDVKPKITYWYGSDTATNTKVQDHIISKMIAEGNHLSYDDYDIQIDLYNDMDDYHKKTIQKYGEDVLIYGCNPKQHAIFESKLDTDFIEYGYYGEPCRSLKSLDEFPNENITVEQFAGVEYIPRYQKIDEYANQRQRLLRWFSDYAEKNLFDKHKLTKNECMYLNYIYRLKADNQMCNLSNLYYYSTPILSQKDVSDGILDVPYEFKLNAKWMLHLINVMYKPLLNYPLFTHTTRKKINKDALTIENTYIDNMKNKIIFYLKKIGFSAKRTPYLTVIYSKYIHNDVKGANELSQEDKIVEYYLSQIERHPTYRLLNNNIREQTHLTSQQYRQLLLVLMQLKNIF